MPDPAAVPTGSVTIRVLPTAPRWVLRADPARLDALAAAWRAPLPAELLRSASGAGRHALRLGPDEWLLLAEERDAAAGLAHDPALSLVEVSSRDVSFEVAGPRAATALNTGCPLDLRPAAFPPAAATRTVFGKAEVVLWRPGVEPAYRLDCLRSFAPYVGSLLRQAVVDL